MIEKITFLLLNLLAITGFSQTMVNGIIMDPEENLGMIGVTVLEKGTTNGTITDIDGRFSLETEQPNPTLVFSFVGYKTMERIHDGSEMMELSMELDAARLEEVVVVGYGTQKKKVVTGAIAKVNGKDMEDQQVTRVESALQGRTSGVRVTTDSGQPGSGSLIRIRGTTTFNNSDPIFVVDGVVVGGGIDYLNPNDIESIEVLKDAASAAIYGTRAANGVIIVTTKSGDGGKPSISYKSWYSVSNPWRKQSLLNANEYATLMNESFAAAGQNIPFPDPSIYDEGTDWQDEIFRENAPTVNHDISINAGGDKSTFFGSAAFYESDGIISADRSNYKRWNLRFNNTNKIGERIKVGTSIAYARVNSQGVGTNSEFGSPLGRALNIDPITPVYETDPNVLSNAVYSNFPVVGDEGGKFAISDYVTSEVLNPVAGLHVGEGFGWSDKVVASGFFEVEPIDKLKFKTSIGTDLAFWGSEHYDPVYYLNASNRKDLNDYNRSQNKGLLWTWENTLSYDLDVSDHLFTALVGTSSQRNKGEGISGTVQDLPISSLSEASLGFAVPAENQSFGGFEYEDRISSLFGRLTYNFKEKYIINATLRVDGSSRFGADNLYGNFPGISLGWNISDENFFLINAVNYLKLRASWGKNGNDRIDNFKFLSQVTTGSNYAFGLDEQLIIGATLDGLSNPRLRWEETTQLNLGFDAIVYKNLSITFDAYQKTSTGILATFEVPSFVGFGSPTANIGEMDNRGLELDLKYESGNKVFEYGVGFNISYNENEVLFISPDTDFIPGSTFGPQGLEITRALVGYPIGSFFGYKTDGLFQNQAEVDAHVNSEGELIQPNAAPGDIKFQDFNGDGILDEEDRTVIGDPTPTWTYGSFLELFYKNFELNLFGQGVWGNEIFKANRRFDLQMANLPGEALGRWTGEGTSSVYPRLVANDPNQNFSRSSDFFIESGAYFRLKNLQLAYTLPNRITQKALISKAKLYVSVNNAITITKYSGMDPEIVGVDRGLYPQPRSFLFGVNITFQ